jgi:hypothetical protein
MDIEKFSYCETSEICKTLFEKLYKNLEYNSLNDGSKKKVFVRWG